MTEAVIVDAIRTPGGKRGGQLKDWHPVDLAAEVLKELVKRNNLDTELVDDVIFGCVSQTGEQSVNVARNAVAMGAQCVISGVVGADDGGDRLIDRMKELGVDPSGMVRVEGRPTTRKTRVEALLDGVETG